MRWLPRIGLTFLWQIVYLPIIRESVLKRDLRGLPVGSASPLLTKKQRREREARSLSCKNRRRFIGSGNRQQTFQTAGIVTTGRFFGEPVSTMVNDSISCANGPFELRLDFRKRRLRH